MTKEQYEKLKEWIHLMVVYEIPKADGYDSPSKYVAMNKVEKELDKLMGFE